MMGLPFRTTRASERPLTNAARSTAKVVALSPEVSDDVTLVEKLIAREPASVAQLFDRYADLLRSLMTRMLGSSADVDDLVQEAFLIVIAKVGELQKPEALRSFVVSIAMGLTRNELRKRAVRRFVRFSDIPPPSVPHECDGRRNETVVAVYRALDQLDATSRVLFVMRRVEGWELRDLAEAEGCSLATLKRRLQKAEERFRAIAAREPALQGLLEAEE
jgi:RNA polymerase sigma-70 factor (ECF subfamily)